MAPPDLTTLEQRFQLIQSTYARLGMAPDPRVHRRIERTRAAVARLLRVAREAQPLPERVQYSVLKQTGRPQIRPRAFMNPNVRRDLEIGLKWEIAAAQNIDREAAAALTAGPIEQLSKAIATGELNDWLRFYESFASVGLQSDLPAGKAPALSFWSGTSAGGVRASDMAKKYSDSGAGSRDIDQVAFKAVKTAAGAAGPLLQSDRAAYDHVWYELFGLQSGLYATLARGDVICFLPRGISVGNIFWNNELPVLRRLQQHGLVDDIFVYSADVPPDGHDDAALDDEHKRDLWFQKAVRLTSPGVKLSKRQADGAWVELGIEADFFVKWLLGHRANRRHYLVLYGYRLATGIWGQLRQGESQDHFVIELSRPGADSPPRLLDIVGYHEDAEVLPRLRSLEKYLFANHADWTSLPVPPDRLTYAEDAVFLSSGGRARLQAIKHDGGWYYADNLRPRLSARLGPAGAGRAVDGEANEDADALRARVAAVRQVIGEPPPQPPRPARAAAAQAGSAARPAPGTAAADAPASGGVKQLISLWEGRQ